MSRGADPPRRLNVAAGAVDRLDTIVRAPLGLPPGTPVLLHEAGGDDRPLPAQVDPAGDLVWVLAGPTAAGTSRSFVAEVGAEGPGRDRVVAELHPAIVAIALEGRTVAHYNYRSVWKPYFCPLMGPTGNVVRGASAEHQHQAGLFFSYGGHFTPTNIWSDWDEPIYGPDGKMLDRGFEVVAGGPLFAHLVQRIGYMAADGSFVLEERRDMRVYPLPGGVTVVDLVRSCSAPEEPSLGPFNLSCRVADPLRTVDMARRGPPPERKMQPTDNPGRMESSTGEVSQGENVTSQRWLDRSGELAGGWGGLAFFDHPSNPGYPGRLSAAGYGTMGLGYDYPAGAPRATWRYRVYTHAGGAADARIEARWQDYAAPPTVTPDPSVPSP
jgi:hypothetical protein